MKKGMSFRTTRIIASLGFALMLPTVSALAATPLTFTCKEKDRWTLGSRGLEKKETEKPTEFVFQTATGHISANSGPNEKWVMLVSPPNPNYGEWVLTPPMKEGQTLETLLKALPDLLMLRVYTLEIPSFVINTGSLTLTGNCTVGESKS